MDWKGYGVLIAAFFTISIAYSVRYGFGLLLPGMVETLRISKTEAGLISSTYFCAYTAFSPVLGVLSDRVSARLLITIFCGILAGATLAMAFVPTMGWAALVFAIAGAGHAACWAPVVALVQRRVPDRIRGVALAVASMGSGVGIIFWSLWLPGVIGQGGYHLGWMQMGGVGLVVAVVNYALIRDPPREPKDSGTASGTASISFPYRQLLRSRNLWLVGGSYACISFAVLVPLTFLGVYATEELKLDFAGAAHFFTTIAAAALLGKPLFGAISDRFGRIPLVVISNLCIALGSVAVANGTSLPGKYLAVAIIGLGFGAIWPLYAAVAVDIFPKRFAGGVIGLWTVFMGIGSLLSPVVCGWLIDVSGTAVWAFRLGCVIALGSVLFLLPLRGDPGIVRGKTADGMA